MASVMASCASSSCISRRLFSTSGIQLSSSSSSAKASISTLGLLTGWDSQLSSSNNVDVLNKMQHHHHHHPNPSRSASTWTSTKTKTTMMQPPSQQQHQQQYHQKRFFGMNDEYGEMDSDGHSYIKENFQLENGIILPEAQLRYRTYGTLNDRRDNVVVVCHALTGNASLHTWWGGLLGDNMAFDTSKYLIVCCNILGSCYGSTNPQSINPNSIDENGNPTVYGKDFPDVSVLDTVKLQLTLLQEELGIHSIKSVIGGSFGGMQAIEYAVQGGSKDADFVTEDGSPFVRSSIPIACGASHTAWQIAISEVQRQAIYSDPQWDIDGFSATKGLEVARQMGMVSYRTPLGYHSKFGRQLKTDDSPLYGSGATWQVKSYLEYQGTKFIDRFDPITYVKLTEQMDSHDVGRNRGTSIAEVLNRVEIPVRVLGIDSDVLYPLSEQEEMVEHLPNAQLQVINSIAGHDGFLLEQDQVAKNIVDFLDHND